MGKSESAKEGVTVRRSEGAEDFDKRLWLGMNLAPSHLSSTKPTFSCLKSHTNLSFYLKKLNLKKMYTTAFCPNLKDMWPSTWANKETSASRKQNLLNPFEDH